jgi:ribonucleotide reductase alpha subunit
VQPGIHRPAKYVTDGSIRLRGCSITRVVTRNLNKVIDINYYPIPGSAQLQHAPPPIGLGVQGSPTRLF